MFSPRSLDVDVVLDLMIHDVDIVLALAGANPEEIRAAGISILSPKVDIANVRLQFPNGCVANLTASRVSTERVRKLRLFQPQQYLSLDYARQELLLLSVGENRQIAFEPVPVTKAEPLKLQLDAFLDSVETRNPAKTSGPAARQTLRVALAILDKIKEHSEIVSKSLVSGWKLLVRSPAESAAELHLLTEWGEDRSRVRSARVLSVTVHVLVIAALALAPRSLMTPPPRRVATQVTPLIEPLTELTQKAPNKGKISKEITVEALRPRPRIQIPALAAFDHPARGAEEQPGTGARAAALAGTAPH